MGIFFSETRTIRNRKKQQLHPICELSRLHVLVCCFFCSITVSLTYAFDLFTTPLQDQFGLSGGDLSTVTTIGLVFSYFQLHFAVLYEHCGPFLLFVACMVLGGLGALLMGLAFDGKVKGSTATFTVYYAMLCIASGLVDCAYIPVLNVMFPRNRGPVISLVKVMTSLGASLLAIVCYNLFGNAISGYCYMIMALTIAMNLWACFVVTLPPYVHNWWRRRGKTEEELRELEATQIYYAQKSVPLPRIVIGYCVVVVLVVYYAVEGPIVAYASVTHSTEIALAVVAIILTMMILLVLLPLPILGGMNEPEPPALIPELARAEGNDVEEEELLEHVLPQKAVEPVAEAEEPCERGSEPLPEATEPATKRDMKSYGVGYHATPPLEWSYRRQDPSYMGNYFDYIRGLDFWIVYGMIFCSGVMGVLVSYNGTTISSALQGKPRDAATSALFTSLLGVSSTVGRLGFGMVEAFVQSRDPEKRRFTITIATPAPALISTVGGILLLAIPSEYLLLPYIIVYVGHGMFAAVIALIFACLFENNLSSMYNTAFFFYVITIVVFNRCMFGIWNDKKTAHYNDPLRRCLHPDCVRVPLIVGTVVTFLGSLFAIAAHIRYQLYVNRVRREWERMKAELGVGVSSQPESTAELE